MQSNVSPAHDNFISWCKSVGLDPGDSGLAYFAFNAGFEIASKSALRRTTQTILLSIAMLLVMVGGSL